MISSADIREPSSATQIYVLQQAAYSVEAQRIGCVDFPPLRETLEALRRSTDCFLVFTEAGSVLGFLSYESSGSSVTITRLAVNPLHFRRGIATALLRELESRVPVGTLLCAATADLNEPAIRAFEMQGYRTVSREMSPEGIALRRLHKPLDSEDDRSPSQHDAS